MPSSPLAWEADARDTDLMKFSIGTDLTEATACQVDELVALDGIITHQITSHTSTCSMQVLQHLSAVHPALCITPSFPASLNPISLFL